MTQLIFGTLDEIMTAQGEMSIWSLGRCLNKPSRKAVTVCHVTWQELFRQCELFGDAGAQGLQAMKTPINIQFLNGNHDDQTTGILFAAMASGCRTHRCPTTSSSNLCYCEPSSLYGMKQCSTILQRPKGPVLQPGTQTGDWFERPSKPPRTPRLAARLPSFFLGTHELSGVGTTERSGLVQSPLLCQVPEACLILSILKDRSVRPFVMRRFIERPT